MAVLRPLATAGKVNGLSRPAPYISHRRVRLPVRHPTAIVALGAAVYAFALLFPLALRQVTGLVMVAAFAGTGILLWGLHVRWTRAGSKSGEGGA